MKKLSTLLLVLGFVLCAAATPAANARVLRIGCTSTADSNIGQGFLMFEKLFEEYTNGAFDVQCFPGGQLGNERDLIEGVAMGTIEMCVSTTGPIINFSKDLMLLDLPYVIMDTPEGRRKAYAFMDGPLGAQMLSSLENNNLKGIGFWENGFRNIINSKKKVVTVEDLVGLKIRTMENDIHMAFYNLNGGNGIPMASSEAFTALQQGVIDGMDNVVNGFYTQKAYEAAKYLTMSRHFYSPSVMMVNLELYNSMTDDQKAALKRAQMETAVWERQFTHDEDEKQVKLMAGQGVTVIDVDLEDWKRAAKPLYDKYLPQINPEYVKALLD